jgi:pentatricopeptide repeat protein
LEEGTLCPLLVQDIYVATNLLIVYIRYGRLEDARRLFDELVKRHCAPYNVREVWEHRGGKENF